MTPDEEGLLQQVLVHAKGAQETAQRLEQEFAEHVRAESQRSKQVDARLDAHDAELARLGNISSDLQGVRGDIQTLNRSVMESLSQDAQRERAIGDLKTDVATMAKKSGRSAGFGAGAIISGIVTLVWLVAFIIAVTYGVTPPSLP